MSLSHTPVAYLSNPSYARHSHSKSALYTADYAFFIAALVIVCGGCLFMMDLASAQSYARESLFLSTLSQLAHSVPALWAELSTYLTLLLSSILTSGILVGFVIGLRALDQKVTGSSQQQSSSFFTVKAAQLESMNQYKAALRGRESRIFLLSPVYQ